MTKLNGREIIERDDVGEPIIESANRTKKLFDAALNLWFIKQGLPVSHQIPTRAQRERRLKKLSKKGKA